MNIVFVWAGGTGMSGLALMLFDLWYHNIVAIDAVESLLMTKIKEKWIKTFIWHGKYAVQKDDFVIYSDIPAIVDGPEISTSREYQKTPTKKYFHICLSYNQFIAEISKRFITISVAGSNGKTSTTGMLIYTLCHSGLDPESLSIDKIKDPESSSGWQKLPTFWLWIVGWLMPDFDQHWYAINTFIQSDIRHLFDHIFSQKHQLNYDLLKKYIFVIEACEYKEHFLLYDNDYILVTNIERDHTDYFTTYEHYTEVFLKCINKTKRKVILTPSAYATLEQSYATDTTQAGQVRSQIKDTKISISLDYAFTNPTLIGKYYESNAGMIEKLLQELWYHDTMKLWKLLAHRKGMWRRMEYIWQNNNWASIYSDYSHHAPAIAGNIEAITTHFPDKKIVVIFQPHQAQRVLVGRDDFATALQNVDELIIYKLYTAREDFFELQQKYNTLESISSFEELGKIFAESVWWCYITEAPLLYEQIEWYDNNTIIVYFSAGDLDQMIRFHIIK